MTAAVRKDRDSAGLSVGFSSPAPRQSLLLLQEMFFFHAGGDHSEEQFWQEGSDVNGGFGDGVGHEDFLFAPADRAQHLLRHFHGVHAIGQLPEKDCKRGRRKRPNGDCEMSISPRTHRTADRLVRKRQWGSGGLRRAPYQGEAVWDTGTAKSLEIRPLLLHVIRQNQILRDPETSPLRDMMHTCQ